MSSQLVTSAGVEVCQTPDSDRDRYQGKCGHPEMSETRREALYAIVASGLRDDSRKEQDRS